MLRREPSYPLFISDLRSKEFIWDGRWKISVSRSLKKFEHIGPLGKWIFTNKKICRKKPVIEGFLSTPTLFKKDIVVSSPMLKYGDVLSCKLKYNKKQFINCFITH